MKAVKEQGVKWLVEWAEYMADNPQIIVKGFIEAGISVALDGNLEDPDDVNEHELEPIAALYEADIDQNLIMKLKTRRTHTLYIAHLTQHILI